MKKAFATERKDGEVSVLLVDDSVMRELNSAYRGIDLATDVLAFALNEGAFPDPNPEMFGDIVVSMETATRQAAAAGHSTEQELACLLVHGALHLLGYDHEGSREDAERMARREREILGTLVSDGIV